MTELLDRRAALEARGWTFFEKPEKSRHLDTMTVRTEPGSWRAERLRDDASGNLSAAGGTLEACVVSAENTDRRQATNTSTRIEVH